MVCQRDEQPMVMPTQPTAQFVVVEADFAFGFLKNDFNRPTHPTDAHQFEQGNADGRIAEVELELAGVLQIAADDQPEFGTRQAVACSTGPRKGKVTADGTLLASFTCAARPPAFGRPGGDWR